MHRPLSLSSLRPLVAAIALTAALFLPLSPVLAEGEVVIPSGVQSGGTSYSTNGAQAAADETAARRDAADAAVLAAPAAAADAPATTAETAQADANTPGQTLDTPNWMATTFASVAQLVASVLGTLIVAILDVTIPVMQYQGFVGSPVVVAGWAIVRDVVNMFFVVILIVIAMGTIFGSSKFTWRQQVPKLMLFAILINFSKTLCGLMIDFAQVIMLTFANALKDIAGGNFIQLLGLGPMMNLSSNSDSVRSGISSFDLFAASAAAVIMMVWVLAIVIMLLFILVYRVVMLWILIVMAPLAWFTAAVPFDQAKGSYAEWWKNFVCYCTVGPVITFFLWLTLAVAGAGSIAASDTGFSSTQLNETGINTSGGITKIFEWENLTSFVIGMAMLVAGMDAAAKVCSGIKKAPGFDKLLAGTKGGGFINQWAGGKARKYGEKGARWTGGKAVDLAGGTGAAIVAAGATGSLAGFGMGRAGQAARAEGLRAASKTLGAHGLGGMARTASMAADSRQADLAKTMKEAAEETYKGASDETKLDELIRLADGGGQLFEGGASMGLLAEALKNPKMRERLEASGRLESLMKNGSVDKLKKQLRGTKDYEAIEEFENGRPDLSGNFSGINSEDDLRKLDPTALAKLRNNADFRKQLATFKTNTKGTGGITMNGLEYLNSGYGSGKQARAWKDGMTGVYEAMSPKVLDLVPAETIAAHLSDSIVSKRPNVAPTALRSRSNQPRTRMNLDRGAKHKVNASVGIAYDPATGRIASVDSARIANAVGQNPLAVKNVSLDDDNAAGSLKQAIAGAYMDQDSLKGLLNQYKISSPADRREMGATIMENVLESFESEATKANSSGNTGLEANIRTQMNNLRVQLETIEGGNANMISEIRTARADLRTEEARLAALGAGASPELAARLATVRADVVRLGNYGARF